MVPTLETVQQKVVELNTKLDNLADKGLNAWARKSYSAWIMLGVVVVLPLIGVVVGYNLK